MKLPVRRIAEGTAVPANRGDRITLPELARTIAVQGETMLRGRMAEPSAVTVDFDEDLPFAYDCTLRRETGRVRLTFSAWAPALVERAGRYHAMAYLYWFATDPGRADAMTGNCSDGDRASGARFSQSAFLPGVVPFPDSYFLASQAYATHRREGQAPVPWAARSDLILWRGKMNGPDSFVPAIAMARPERAAQRMLLVLAARGLPAVDVRFIDAELEELSGTEFQRLALVGEFVPALSWAARKFAIDVDGWSNAWPNYFCRMLDGCCVFKVASRYGYRQWYYDRLRPWDHYIPVAADLSDFAERVEWARAHDAECAQIARRAREVMLGQTFEAVSQEAWDLLAQHAGT